MQLTKKKPWNYSAAALYPHPSSTLEAKTIYKYTIFGGPFSDLGLERPAGLPDPSSPFRCQSTTK